MNEKSPSSYYLSHSTIVHMQLLFIYANLNCHVCMYIVHPNISEHIIHSLYSFFVFFALSGNYFNKKDKTAMVAQDYGFIDAPPCSKPNNSSAGSNNRPTVVNNNNNRVDQNSGIQTKETIGNHSSSNANHSRTGKFIHV